MADTQQIVVELILDDSQLETGLDKLEKSGQIDAKLAGSFKQTNAELAKRSQLSNQAAASATREQQIYNKLVASLKTLSGESKKAVENLLKMSTGEVAAGFDKAAVSVDDYIAALQAAGNQAGKTEQATESFRERLKNLTQQIAQVKLTGEQWEGQLSSLVGEAGRIKDAMADAGAEIKNAASDTRVFDNLLGSAQAIAGGFAVAQGAAALFGKESDELQQTLLKVNAAMALLQGLQQVGNALQKEGAVVQLLSNRQRLITNAQLAIENGLQSTSVVVRLAAAAAQRVLNAAMNANPILLFVSALIVAVSAIAAYVASSRKAEIQTGELNAAVEAATEGFENYSEQVKLNTEKITSELEKNGALQSKILEAQQKAEADINQKRSEEIARLRKFLTTSRDADEDAINAANARIAQLNKERNEADIKSEIEKNNLIKQIREENIRSQIGATEAALLAAKEGSKQQLELQKKLITLQSIEALNATGLTEAEKTAIIAHAQKERHDKDIEFNKREIDEQLKTIDIKLINVRNGSNEEFRLKIQQLRLQTQSEIQSAKLSEDEIRLIKERAFQEEVKLIREHNSLIRKEAIEDQISRNNAELTNIQTNADDKLLLTVANIDLSAALEIDAAEKNSAKIKEINAKRDADIIAARRASLEQQAQQELDLLTVNQAAHLRALQRIAGDEKKSTQVRIAAIQEAASIELDTIQKKEDTLKEELDKRLITEEEFNVKYKQLQDDKAKISEEVEQQITAIQKAENEKRTQIVFETLNAVSDLLQGINDNQKARENQNLEDEKNRVQELLEAGAITEKEAKARNKRIEIEEKRLRREQAQRDKGLAIFQAIINTAQAVTRALGTGGPILAAIVAALGAVQIGIIANRPIPKFRTGKKNQYQGPGEIGEAGAELLQKDGQMYLAKSKSIVWLGKDDKVFTPEETGKALMNGLVPQVDRETMRQSEKELISSKEFAAIIALEVSAAVAKEVKKIPMPSTNIDEQGIKVWIQEGISRTKYMDKQYSSK